METIYIDVYFLINLTVDLLALYFAASFSRVPSTSLRLFFGAFIGAVYAVISILFISSAYISYPLSIFALFAITFVVAGRVGVRRRIRLTVAFFIFELMLGGIVYYGYCFLDKYAYLFGEINDAAESRRMIILSLLILLAIGILKLMIAVFSNTRMWTHTSDTLQTVLW